MSFAHNETSWRQKNDKAAKLLSLFAVETILLRDTIIRMELIALLRKMERI